MNWLDVILLLPLLVGLVRGLMRGLVSEIIAIMVVILGVLFSRLFAAPFSEWLCNQFSWAKEACDITAYILLFLTTAVVLYFFSRLFTKTLNLINLGWANKLSGGVFGALKYGIIVLIAVFVLDKTNQSTHWLDDSPVVQSSIVYPRFVELERTLISNFQPIDNTQIEDNQ